MSSEVVNGSKKTWLDLLSERAVEQIFDAFAAKAEAHGQEFVNDLYLKFLENYTAYLVFQTLKAKPQDDKDRETFVLENFAALKIRAQDAVAFGFGNAMTAFTKNNVDYYCQIKIVPPAANKEPC